MKKKERVKELKELEDAMGVIINGTPGVIEIQDGIVYLHTVVVLRQSDIDKSYITITGKNFNY